MHLFFKPRLIVWHLNLKSIQNDLNFYQWVFLDTSMVFLYYLGSFVSGGVFILITCGSKDGLTVKNIKILAQSFSGQGPGSWRSQDSAGMTEKRSPNGAGMVLQWQKMAHEWGLEEWQGSHLSFAPKYASQILGKIMRTLIPE